MVLEARERFYGSNEEIGRERERESTIHEVVVVQKEHESSGTGTSPSHPLIH